MKHYITAAAVCGCLLLGSLYPKLLLDHHVKLIDQNGSELLIEGDYDKEIPVRLESGFWKFFRSMK